MRRLVAVACLSVLCAVSARAENPACVSNSEALGVLRTITIDASGGPAFGEPYTPSRQFLLPREVVLTFDDGPFPVYTEQILDALDAECTKATFFEVGAMAAAYPDLTRKVLERGHTIGTHTWSHANLAALSTASGEQQIEKAVAKVDANIPGSVAPFFRFPYLADKKQIREYLATRNIAIFDIDVDSFDYRMRSPEQVVRNVMNGLEKTDGGIILMHDIHSVTAKAVPLLLSALKKADFHVVHLVPKVPVQPVVLTAEETKSREKASSPKRHVSGKRKASPEESPAFGLFQ